MFESVASKYDLMNDLMSGGIHRLWKDFFVQTVNPQSDSKIIDVAGGTGDIAFRLARHADAKAPLAERIVVYDINKVCNSLKFCLREEKIFILQKMLDVGEYRADTDAAVDPRNYEWVCGDAEHLPFESGTFDLYTIAFGIRNCTRVDRVLAEAHRVLKPGGRFACLEFSKIHQPLQPLYDLYSFQVIPVLGKLVANDYDSYKYLVESIRMFPSQVSAYYISI